MVSCPVLVSRRSVASCLLATCLVASGPLAACTDGPGASGGPDATAASATAIADTGPDQSDVSDNARARIAAVTAARDAVRAPVAALAAAATATADLVAAWADDPAGVDLVAGVAALAPRVREAVAGIDGVLDASSADVAAAEDALQVGAAAVNAQFTAADGLTDQFLVVADVANLVDEFVVTVNEAGSRSEQRNAMTALVDDFNAAAATVEAAIPSAPCAPSLQVAADALADMTTVAEELATLATNGQGDAFDDLRASASADPFGLGTTDLVAASEIAACTLVAAAGDTAALDMALAEVESALNPPDLVDR